MSPQLHRLWPASRSSSSLKVTNQTHAPPPNQPKTRFSGPTVHFVDAEYDTGPILAQRVVAVLPTDSPKQLAARVLQQVRGAGWVGDDVRLIHSPPTQLWGLWRPRATDRDDSRVHASQTPTHHTRAHHTHTARAGAPGLPRGGGCPGGRPHHVAGRWDSHHVERPLRSSRCGEGGFTRTQGLRPAREQPNSTFLNQRQLCCDLLLSFF